MAAKQLLQRRWKEERGGGKKWEKCKIDFVGVDEDEGVVIIAELCNQLLMTIIRQKCIITNAIEIIHKMHWIKEGWFSW